ncbi:MAG: glutaminase [Phyllobacteriaceae bacterium]|nr:glutaminase [Phyllobacteriaceae bacterium]
MSASEPDFERLVGELAADMDKIEERGDVARYIPQLARVNPSKFGVVITLLDGRVFSAGHSSEAFSIQSISKVFSLTLALGKSGDDLWRKVGREPSGSAFNSIVQLENEQGRPRNPFINAGAIAVTDILLAGHRPSETIGEILRFVRFLADDDSIIIDDAVARSEAETGHRNVALAEFMASYGKIQNPVSHLLGVYFHQCAIAMNCLQLAQAGLFLAAGGKNPQTGSSVVNAARARRINALMMLCGHYDASGDFAYRVGLPGKSGVGGGILAIAPGKASIAVWSPGLNAHGNSLLGTLALERIAKETGWSVFG